METYQWEPYETHFATYTVRLLRCKNCGYVFQDGDNRHVAIGDRRILVCDSCVPLVKSLIDFDVNGSKEPEDRKWQWMRRLALKRDHQLCRICGNYKDGIAVHHIIPKKAGGTNSLRNLITLCERHHKETYKNDYAGLRITDYFIQKGIQKILTINRS